VKKSTEYLTAITILAALYFAAGNLGLRVAFVHPSSTAVWPPTGITLAAFLILGYRVWPGVFLGAFLVNFATAGTIATSLGIATGNTLEGIAGAYLVSRFAGGRRFFESAQDTFKFAGLAGLLSTTLSATVGTTSLSLGGIASWTEYKPIWFTWWLGDAVGDLVFAPLLILWFSNARVKWNWVRFAEFAVLMMSLLFVGQVVFGTVLFPAATSYPLEYLCIPILVWAAFRFGQREVATVILTLFGLANWGTFHGFGPFVRESRNESVLLLQSFMGVVAVMTMGLAAVIAERQRAERQAQHLAVTDGLTGLANYRKLVEVFDLEIKRCGRTGRSFAVLLLDLNGLKKINDQYGHLTGTRTLCRLADILRFHCRSIDTAARYGGDEFTIVIPEAGLEAAQQVAGRICDRIVNDGEQPAFTVSVGTAVYPQDGETIDELLGAADRALYQMKLHPRSEILMSGPGSPP
jgi:diguanylate cyclase (GGDEF)-like protein